MNCNDYMTCVDILYSFRKKKNISTHAWICVISIFDKKSGSKKSIRRTGTGTLRHSLPLPDTT